MNKPEVGVGVIIENGQGEILVCKRIGSHAQMYSIPGGRLELGETFEEARKREIEEEVGLVLPDPRVIAVTNNLETYRAEGIHFISVILLAQVFEGVPKIREPHKCSELFWCKPKKVPEPHFDASRLGIQAYLEGSFYVGISE